MDIETVIKSSQALSSEIVLNKLIEKLMRIAVEHAGAERGLLILLRGDEPQIEAEATTGQGRAEVTVRQAAITPSDLAQSVLHYVVRTRERVVVDDVSVRNLYSEDEYVRSKHARSVLCLPIVKQTKLIGALYLENNLTPRAFTSDRVAVLEMLASQAAISLENAGFYADLKRSEAYLTEAQRLSQTGQEHMDRASREGKACDVECRLLLPDSVKHVRIVAHAAKNESGIQEFIGAVMDVTAAKRAEEKLRRSEAFLAEGQNISHTGSFGWSVLSGEIYWSEETYDIFQDDRAVKPTLGMVLQRMHPDDRDLVQQALDHATNGKTDFDIEHRLLMPDGSVKYLHVLARALETSSGNLEYVGAVTDVTAAKRAEEKLRTSEAHLADAQRLSHTGSWVWRVEGREALHLSEEWYRLYGFDPEDGMPTWEERLQRIHPEDRAKWQGALDQAIAEKSDYEVEFRILLPGGTVKYIHTVGRPVLNACGDLVQFVGSSTDITERKQAEEKIRQSEMELRQILDFAPQYVAVLGPDCRGSRLYANQVWLDYLGLTLEEWQGSGQPRFFHPDDWERMTRETQSKFLGESPFETEARLLRKDAMYRWFLLRYNPLRDEQGRLMRWYLAGTDIEELKQAEQRLQNENVVLREEIDKASMFEEIVGVSPALHAVLSRLSKVAPTDSTVLITGETGTGKELIARGVHKRSKRSSRAFVSVNCAAIPRDLIASELFGHEKGAFTGATQRRLGRFELAEGGTIFLDEVGELPAETQIALLRVLQEHEFERVGGTGSIRTNVRVIAATNRDLEEAINAGMFRSDLFYRLNVFPIEIPALRERREDIPLLVEYFIDRYAKKAGKRFQAVNKKSLDLLQSYPWPGNIRELQNVIERSVIVCETENFSVDGGWLSRQPHVTRSKSDLGLSRKPAAKEKEIIEAALRESGGRVSGPSGAAAKLGIPGSTLESKIRSLKVSKNRFKTTDPSVNRF